MIFIVIIIIEFIVICLVGFYSIKKYYEREKAFREEIKTTRADAIKRSRSVIEGQVFEQIVPYLPQWSYSPSDARFLGSPIDFIVFEGMSEGEVNFVTIVEIKTGNSHTTPIQNKVKKAIKEGRVKWETLTIKTVLPNYPGV